MFARISPDQKSRIIKVARRTGRDVAFLGDGVNDAVALHHADVGISVNSGTDVAKDAADVVLLDKDLGVLAEGVMEGRRIFANTMKYVLMATSSNFGNMFSAAGASVFLSFLPMLPSQILLNNLLYNTGQLAIPTDRVDPEALARPAAWDMKFIRRFMSVFGPVSSIFDFLTFWVMLSVLHAGHTEFRTGWFVESIATQTLVVYVIRTRRIPFFKSRPSLPMLLVPTGAALVGAILPYTGLAHLLGFTPLPADLLPDPLRHGRRLPGPGRTGQDPLLPDPPPPHPPTSIHPHRTPREAHPPPGRPLHPPPDPMVRNREPTLTSPDTRRPNTPVISTRALANPCALRLSTRIGGISWVRWLGIAVGAQVVPAQGSAQETVDVRPTLLDRPVNRVCRGTCRANGRVEAMGIEPTNLLHAMQFLSCPACLVLMSCVGMCRLVSSPQALRHKGFVVPPVPARPVRPLLGAPVLKVSIRGTRLRCWLR